MTDAEVLNRLIKVATQCAAERSSHAQILDRLWDDGFLPARQVLLEEGVPSEQVHAQMAKAKEIFGVVEPADLTPLPLDLQTKLTTELEAEIHKESGPELLAERHIREITEYKVEMWSNESKHAGRPHVTVTVRGVQISVSLDEEPKNLTPKGTIVGEASALRVVKKNRERLLQIWEETRPDTQKLSD